MAVLHRTLPAHCCLDCVANMGFGLWVGRVQPAFAKKTTQVPLLVGPFLKSSQELFGNNSQILRIDRVSWAFAVRPSPNKKSQNTNAYCIFTFPVLEMQAHDNCCHTLGWKSVLTRGFARSGCGQLVSGGSMQPPWNESSHKILHGGLHEWASCQNNCAACLYLHPGCAWVARLRYSPLRALLDRPGARGVLF
eukprot:1335172-Amphidinium_carterae.1